MKLMNSIILVILISAGAVCLAMAVNEVPELWSLIRSWLRPPYLHVVINGIIIAIVAASRFRRNHPPPPVRSQHLISATTPPPAYYAAYSSPPEVRTVVEAAWTTDVHENDDRVVELKAVMVNGREVLDEDEGEIAFSDRTLTYDTPSPERFTPEFQLEYFPAANPTGNVAEITHADVTQGKTISEEGPSRAALEEFRHGGEPRPVPDRFRYNTRKSKSFKERTIYDDSPPSHASSPRRNKLKRRLEAEDVHVPADGSLTYYSRSPEIFSPEFLLPEENDTIKNVSQRVKEPPPTTEEEAYETLESAWKKVTEGSSRAAGAAAQEYVGAPQQPSLDVLKSSSFKERAIYNESAAISGIRKEVSPSHDELNRRVEAFIKKVNGEIRLRRQKSSNQYMQLNSAA